MCHEGGSGRLSSSECSARMRIYSDLAPWFHLLTHPSDYEEEADFIERVVDAVADRSRLDAPRARFGRREQRVSPEAQLHLHAHGSLPGDARGEQLAQPGVRAHPGRHAHAPARAHVRRRVRPRRRDVPDHRGRPASGDRDRGGTPATWRRRHVPSGRDTRVVRARNGPRRARRRRTDAA